MFGYLGRNGAGKSTTMRILTTCCGRRRDGEGRWPRRLLAPRRGAQGVGAALQEAALDELMTGREHLDLAARLAGLGKRGVGSSGRGAARGLRA